MSNEHLKIMEQAITEISVIINQIHKEHTQMHTEILNHKRRIKSLEKIIVKITEVLAARSEVK